MATSTPLTFNQLFVLKSDPGLYFYCEVEVKSLMFNASVWVWEENLNSSLPT